VAYSGLKEELGLVDPMWSSHPSEWRRLCTLWLRVDSALGRTGRTDLSIQEINDLIVPPDIIAWMLRTQHSQDHPPPDGGFGDVWTTFLSRLTISEWETTSDIIKEMWCRPGPTGVVLFLLGTYWQSEYSGTGKSWYTNIKRVESIFNCILANPAVYVLIFYVRIVS
jgi:hypothetical protein